jgi:adenosine deaminase
MADENAAAHIIEKMPKVDLHRHLAGSVSPETLYEIASREDIELPFATAEELHNAISVGETCRSLSDYLQVFKTITRCLQSGSALRRSAYEAVQRAAAHNTVYMEVRFAPLKHRERGLRMDEIIRAVFGGLAAGERDFGLRTGLLLICMRHHSAAENREVIEYAARHADAGVVGVDVAGDEGAYPLEPLRDVLREARGAGVHLTVHAGEAAGAASIRQAVDCGAERIGHGISLGEDEGLLKEVVQRGICLEMCPTSNLQTGAVESFRGHPLPDYLHRGVNVTVNTDNPVPSGTGITREYSLAHEEMGLSLEELQALTTAGLAAAFSSDAGGF